MTKNKTNPKVDFFFTEAEQWQDEFKKLRTIILGCGLTEELRGGASLVMPLREATCITESMDSKNTARCCL